MFFGIDHSIFSLYYYEMDALIFSLNSILPILLLAILGFYLKRIGLFTNEFLKVANSFVFKVCLPTLLFVNVYNVENLKNIPWNVVGIAGFVTFIIFFLGIIYVLIFIKKEEQKGAVLQGFFRSNYIVIGLPLAFSIGGAEAQILASVIAAFMVPLYNILAVIALTIFLPQHGAKKSFFSLILDMLKKIVTNPLILGAMVGLVCLAIRPFIGEWRLKTSEFQSIFKAIENLTGMATPLALVVLGGEFSFSAVKRLFPQILQVVVVRLVVVPLIGLVIISQFFPSFGTVEYAALLGLFAAPTAVSSAVMAQSMGNDGELARQIVVWTSVFSVFTLFAFTAFFRSIGIF